MRNLHLSVIALSVASLVGCKAIDAMDNTEVMSKDLAQMKSTTSDMAGTTDEMKDSTAELERKAAVDAGLRQLADPNNNKEFTPPQPGLLAGAKLVAEHMTNEELINYFYARMKELNKTVADDSQQDPRYVDVGGYSPKYVAQFNRHKQVLLVALQAIAAQIPQAEMESYKDKNGQVQTRVRKSASVEVLIREQILGSGGRFSDTAFALLMLRANFINNFYLDAGVFSVPMDNMGKLESAFKYTKALQFLATLPFADQIKLELDSTAFLPVVNPPALRDDSNDYEKHQEFLAKCTVSEKHPKVEAVCLPTLGDAPSFNEALDLNIAKPWWNKIVKRIDNQLPEKFKDRESPDAPRVMEIRGEAERNAQ
ncbi:MAG TPA: hypothetical protein VIH99_10300 [Bdellovibrionota bacterium]|jgi:hypothetical protein